MPIAHLLTALATFIIGFIHPVSSAQIHNPQAQQVLAATIRQPQGIAPTIASSPTSIPLRSTTITYSPKKKLIDCIGPDEKHLQITQKACDDFTSAWHHTKTSPTATSPYGQATKIAEHTYELKVQPDKTMATPQEVFQALNVYRQKHGV